MNVEELVAKLKEQGLNDDEIRAELQKIKLDIDAFLRPHEEPQDKVEEVEEEEKHDETEEEKLKRVFGI